MPSGTAPPRPGGTAQGGAARPSYATPGRQQPCAHSYGQANIAGNAAAAAHTDDPSAYSPDAASAAGKDIYCDDDYGDYYYEKERPQQYLTPSLQQYQ